MTRIQLIAPLLALWRRPSETGQGHRTSNNKTHHCSDDSPRAPFPNTQTNTTRLPRLASGFRAPALLQRFWLLTTSQGFHGLFLPDQADFVLFNSLKVWSWHSCWRCSGFAVNRNVIHCRGTKNPQQRKNCSSHKIGF